jgi:hypothetical protein
LQGEVVPASEKEPEVWSAAVKFTVVLETAGLNATELSAYCREHGLKKELQRKEKAMAEMAALLVLRKKGRPSPRRTRKADQRSAPPEGDRADRRGECRWRQPDERLRRIRHVSAHPQTLAKGLWW